MNVADFVRAELPSAPARVLEVGCGAGELAISLAEAGYDVVAIDPEAPAGSLFLRTTIEELEEPGPFDTVVAQLSLHHVHDLSGALDKIAGLLVPGGTVIVDEFAWERLDEAAAESVGIPFDEWHDEHEHLHRSDAMLVELDKRFSRLAFSWEPFLFRESRRVIDEVRERALIAEGRLPAIGLQYVGER